MFGIFKKRANTGCLGDAGRRARNELEESARIGCSIYEIEPDELDQAIRDFLENQMLLVSMTTSICNYTLQDAYYDAGLASPLDGMPDLRFNHDDSRAMLRQAWAGFPNARPNLDMRYRYIAVNKLMSPGETDLWQQMERRTSELARQRFEFRSRMPHEWVGFVKAVKDRDATAAREILNGM